MAFRTNKTPVLQEKTASGSVASFNTILQKPLVNGEFTIQAYQEGTGDPSPVNVRNIIPFNTQKITKTGKNLFDYDSITIGRITFNGESDVRTRSGFVYHLPKGTFTFSARGVAQTYVYMNIMASDGSYKSNLRLSAATPVWNTRTFNLAEGDYIIIYQAIDSVTLNISSNEFMIEAGSTETDYEPYKGETVTVALGEDVYGESYNSVSGVKRKTFKKEILNGTQEVSLYNWRPNTNSVGFCIFLSEDDADLPAVSGAGAAVVTSTLSNKLKTVSYNNIFSNDIDSIALYGRLNRSAVFCRVTDTSLTTVAAINAYLSGNPIEVIYPLAEPIESNIGATPIETLIGTNNIFCDTGDTSVVFNDLDIAKRGSFREVFKLPS